jgi:hypothetical protein
MTAIEEIAATAEGMKRVLPDDTIQDGCVMLVHFDNPQADDRYIPVKELVGKSMCSVEPYLLQDSAVTGYAGIWRSAEVGG